jgi:Mn2+/Fe2+ NRAMP family transporter
VASKATRDPKVKQAAKESFLSGIVSAAADNDPTTVATLAVIGGSLVYGLEWLLVLVVPMFTIVQAIGTQVAAITREGMQAAIQTRYGRVVGAVSLVAIVAVNVVTYAADLDAGAAALALLAPIDYRWFVIPISACILALLVFGTMNKIRTVLALVPIVFLTYVAAAFLAHPQWGDVARGLIPHMRWNKEYVSSAIALIGTTLTVYSYFWQTVEVAAEAPPKKALAGVELAALPGTLVTGAVLWFILIGTAATLGVHHHHVQTAQDAAKALEPVAGRWASIIFGIGLFGSAMLALPVIAAGSANAINATFGWKGSLDKKPREAKRFYAVLFISVATATGLTFLPIRPIALLFSASIVAGFATPFTLALLVMLGSDSRTMGKSAVPVPLRIAGWCVCGIVTLAAIAFIRWH